MKLDFPFEHESIFLAGVADELAEFFEAARVQLGHDRNDALVEQIPGRVEVRVVRGLMYELLDHYLGLPRTDWSARFLAEKKRRVTEASAELKSVGATPAHVGPSLPLERYGGTFRDAWYGNILVSSASGKLMIDFESTPRMRGALEHWQYDTFVTHFEDQAIEPAYVTFVLDADGNPTRMTLKAVSPIADFSYDYQDLQPQKQP
jgi:hypothetical protein